jgi:hypothetical protein
MQFKTCRGELTLWGGGPSKKKKKKKFPLTPLGKKKKACNGHCKNYFSTSKTILFLKAKRCLARILK